MSGTTTTGGTTAPAATIDLSKVAAALAAAAGKADGRTKAMDVQTALQKIRRANADAASALALLQAGGTVAVGSPQALALAAAGVDAATIAAATTTPAQGATGTTASASGTVALAATNGNGTITVPGVVVPANTLGWWANVYLYARGTDGVTIGATVRVGVAREAGAAAVSVGVNNDFGTAFGVAGTAGISVTVAATCAADGSTVTLTLTNTGTAARTVGYVVQRRVGG